MNVLVVDSGGRGHAIAWQFKNDPGVKEVICTPGNAGIAREIRCENARTNEGILELAKREKVDLVFIGPESFLTNGIVDLFTEEKIPVVGPTKRASILEGSKAYTKLLCREIGVPVAEFEIFDNPSDAKDYVENVKYPVVVKADGLAQGKGSIVCSDSKEACKAINQLMVEKIFGEAGQKVVIEKRLYGIEISFFFFTDGEAIAPMPVAQDYKRAYDNDEGLNTGGMGAYSPHRLEGEKLTNLVSEKVAMPLIRGFRDMEGIPYKGILYLGLMLVEKTPYLLEVNVRLGDPEAEVILPRLKTPLNDISFQIINGVLSEKKVEWSYEYFCDVVAAAGRTRQVKNGKSKGWYSGYPARYGKGHPISGIERIQDPYCKIFFAGVSNSEKKGLVTDGGRVLHVVGRGKNLQEARDVAYRSIEQIYFEGIRYRKDIGKE
ncbi:MAG: phosphoribosylamine--glycine ligase [Nitrospirae bacterium CG_4_10_14_0_8_um_filter_41_23]|nr:phosphoribosylamine--glycine ligase [Nitrospirota bacterium]OIP60511.1 MAG: phosphoribosylamine--glycine ligase [Nitrospirae bacterium CG2_30_41_42]PIQ94516.1 MAG: phosphoribosylamine--glycine ligase [Nitrospirae bacterium CG11_big_fil_rev_8_21_14_0_20_41_14]PIV42907.1 MAG: phosphoribosylamine--glycine ligase [Nitrospirae bacterium CG02_land_8_20_14_3_00_41_53]PIW87788.1 MAG: phosphoribosylamine--glycine ligase [Nitrospirae bacterium CG_4_8_14_3_um_filter_41_47]PIY86899.1 MAG: phosphoribosy